MGTEPGIRLLMILLTNHHLTILSRQFRQTLVSDLPATLNIQTLQQRTTSLAQLPQQFIISNIGNTELSQPLELVENIHQQKPLRE